MTINDKQSVHVQFIRPRVDVNPDLRGISLTVGGQPKQSGVMPTLEEVLGADRFELFSWTEAYDGTATRVTAVIRQMVSTQVFSEVFERLSNSPIVNQCQELLPVTSEGCWQANVATMAAETYESSWYWPADKRLPKSAYSNPQPIKIAQADTGISLHPNVVGGFQTSESMDFFQPAGKREGKGVICWGDYHPLFITHGTSTGAMMVGQDTEGLPLHGMTIRGVVELVPCRVAESVVLLPADLDRLAECINWAIDKGIKVVNVSMGAIATPNDPALVLLTKAVERAYKAGVIVCCASGQIMPGMIWPGVYSLKGWSICCGPSRENHDISHQSTWLVFADGYVTIGAPGEYMPQAGWKGGVCSSGIAELNSSEGSSYSAAYTSSVAALWWALNHDALSKMDPRDIVPTFRNTLVKTCMRWADWYPSGKVGPGILNPNKVLMPIQPLQDYSLESSGPLHIERVPGGTYKNVTLYAHGSGSIHVLEPVFVEGKLTLRSESSATISMSGAIICRELEIICKSSALIEADDLEFYDSCHVDVSAASTCRLYLAAEGPITGSVTGPFFINGSTFRAWIYWRQGIKNVSIHRDDWSLVDIANNWGGRWA